MRAPLFSYKKACTPLHRLPALPKLFAQIALCMALFARPHSSRAYAAIQLACGGIIALAFIAARIGATGLKRLRLILALGALYALFRVFSIAPQALRDGEGIRLFAKSGQDLVFFSLIVLRAGRIMEALLYIYRFFMGGLSAMVFFETTSPLQVKAAFETLQNAIARIFPPLRKINPAQTIALAINFIPQIFSAWERIGRAARARRPEGKGAAFFVGSFYAQLAALLSCLISRAETTRRAIANRS